MRPDGRAIPSRLALCAYHCQLQRRGNPPPASISTPQVDDANFRLSLWVSALFPRASSRVSSRSAYPSGNGLIIEKEFIDVETAKASGRLNFNEMVNYLKKHPGIRILLVEKTDRLYRNLKDWVLLDELNIEIHLVKEGVVLSQDSKSSEKFFHGIKVLMAKNYIDNLSEEARKGQQEKAEQGIWPT